MDFTFIDLAFSLAFLGSLFLGLWIYERLAERHAIDRFFAASIPTCSLILSAITLREFLESPFRDWDAVRLVPSFALAHGLQLYYLPDNGPILDMMYGPVTALAYLPVAFFTHRPTLAVLLAKGLTVLFYFLPILYIHIMEETIPQSRHRLFAIYCFFCFCFFTIDSRVLSGSAFWNHADAPALGLSAMSMAVLVYRKGKNDALPFFLSSLLATLAIWTKHVTLPLIVSLPLYVFLSEDGVTFRRFVLWFGLTVGAVSALLLAWFNPSNLWFNLVANPAHQPFQPDLVLENGRAIRELMTECRWVGLTVLFYPLYQFLVLSDKRYRPRNWFKDNRWSLLVISAIFMMPFSLLARVKVGGTYNSFSFTYYFLAAATTLIFIKMVAESSASNVQVTPRTVKLGVILMVVGSTFLQLPELFHYYFKVSAVVDSLPTNPQRMSYNYAQKHPGEVYFPWNLLSHLMAEGKLYNFDYALIDRDLSTFPVTVDHFRSYVPAHVKEIAFSPWAQDQYIMRYFPRFTQQVEDPDLPGWTIYKRPDMPTEINPAIRSTAP